jgi:hypothetical protein
MGFKVSASILKVQSNNAVVRHRKIGGGWTKGTLALMTPKDTDDENKKQDMLLATPVRIDEHYNRCRVLGETTRNTH